MSENEGYLLEVMYPLMLAQKTGGRFSLHTPNAYSDKPVTSIQFRSQDEPELKLSVMMQSDSYFFTRKDKADESFQYASEQLAGWRDSDQGSEYLVTLKKGSSRGKLICHRKGIIGEG